MLKGKYETQVGERHGLSERPVGITYLMLLITHEALSLEGNLAQTTTRNGERGSTKGFRFKMPPTPKGLQMQVELRVLEPWVPSMTPVQPGLWKSHDTPQQQAETSSPPNQSHNRTDPPVTGNQILKDTERTERK